MNKADLDKANALHQDLRKKEEIYNEVVEWKIQHEEHEPNKHLSLSNVGYGWISIPAEKKKEVLNLVHDITLKEFKDADKRFKAFQPQHRDKL